MNGLPAWINDYIQIPFVSGGRTKEGCDCYGLVRLVLAEHFGKHLPTLDFYSDALDGSQTGPVVDRYRPLLAGTRVDTPEPGDAVVLRFRGRHTHIGVVPAPGYIMHTDSPTGVVCERVDSPRIRGRVEGYYRVD